MKRTQVVKKHSMVVALAMEIDGRGNERRGREMPGLYVVVMITAAGGLCRAD